MNSPKSLKPLRGVPGMWVGGDGWVQEGGGIHQGAKGGGLPTLSAPQVLANSSEE